MENSFFTHTKHFVLIIITLLGFTVSSLGQTLLFSEDFEEAGNDTYTSNQSSLAGFSNQWEYSKTDEGRLRLEAGAGYAQSGTKAATLDDYTDGGNTSINYIITTIDLSSFKDSYMLLLTFSYMDHGDEKNTNDKIWVRRGDNAEGQTWIEVYNLNPQNTDDGNWNTITDLNIATYLAKQTSSSSEIQIRFGQEDNWPNLSTTIDDGITFDDISLYGYLSTLEFSDSFENCFNDGWSNVGGDDIDWTCTNARTPSDGTGPEITSDGSYYIFTEASSGNSNKNAYLEQNFDLTGITNPQMQFDYHMYGDDMGSIHIDVNDGSGWDNDVSLISGQQQTNNTDAWRNKITDISAYGEKSNITIRLRGTTGNGYASDIAIDNVLILSYTETPPEPGKTWYAYSTNNDWHVAGDWTLDGATNPQFVNPDNEVPGENDEVIITTGKKVTVSTNNIRINKLEVIGELDVTSTTGHNFATILGSGKISMSGNGGSDNFPSGNAAQFNDAESGGTVNVYGSSDIDLDQTRTFNNLNINLSSGTAYLLANYTLNGNLNILANTFKINDNSASNKLSLTVNGDINVASGTTFGVGNRSIGMTSYDDAHEVICNGNFTNNGTVEFTNLAQPTYNAYPNHAVNLIMSGAANKKLTCNSTTDLYRLVIDKGTDKTYTLTLESSAIENFRLYGRNNESNGDNNTESNKALWIKNGTLELTGKLFIPTLTESGGDYYIPSTAKLWINGDNVTVHSTARTNAETTVGTVTGTGVRTQNDGSQSFSIFGAFQIDKGKLDTKSHGFVMWQDYSSSVTINGGTVETPGLRSASTSTGKYSYIQNGGTVTMYGDIDSDGLEANSATFSIKGTDNVFVMTGGTLEIQDANYNGSRQMAIEIESSDANINVTGGTVRIHNPDDADGLDDFYISTTAPFHNLEISTTNNTQTNVYLLSNIQLNNDVTINGNCLFDVTATNYNVAIGSDFTIASDGVYNPRSNTTTFNGSKQTNLDFTGIAPAFNNVTVAKTVDEKNFTIFSTDQSPAFTVVGEFRLEKGAFDYGTHNVQLNGNIYIADSIGISTSTGYIDLNGGSTQEITSENGAIQNIQVNNDANLTGDLNIFGTLTLNSVLDINTHTLTMFGANANITSSSGSDVSDFSTSNMIQTNGNASDGGLELYLNNVNDVLVFPIGTDANNGGTSPTRYTPTVGSFSSYTDDGYIRISPADEELPMTVGNGASTVISYYWKVRHRDFGTLPTIDTYVFEHHASDLDGVNNNGYKCGKVIDVSPFTQSTENGYNKNNYTATFSAGFDLEFASYTAGDGNRFTTKEDVYYSNGNGRFNTASTWSINDPSGGGSTGVPVAGSIVVIQNTDWVEVHGAIPDLGAIQFDHDEVSYPTPNTEQIPRLWFYVSGTFNVGAVSGTGMVAFDAPDAPVVNGDFGEFGTNPYSYYMYFGGNATLSNIPSPIPNLMVEANTFYINQDISVNGNFVVQENAIAIPQRDLNIAGDLIIGTYWGGTFQFPNQDSPVQVTVGGNIDFTVDPFGNLQDRDLTVQESGTYNIEHKLILKGNILHGSDNDHSIDLWYNNSLTRTILELQGKSDNTYSRTSTSEPQLYRVVLNKGTDQTNSFSFNESFTLRGETSTINNKALDLLNGKLVLNNADVNINLTTAYPFAIPNTAALEVTAGTVNASGYEGGISLDGVLRINGGTVNMDGDTDDEGYIEYGSSGNATIDISSGALTVGTQIRRLRTNATGVINYIQTGGDVIIGVNTDEDAYDEDRAMFEALGESNFTLTGGTFTIVRQNGNTPTVAALYLEPTTYDVAGSTITLGNGSTPSGQNSFNINSAIALNDLTLYSPNLADAPNYNLHIRKLTIGGNLIIGNNLIAGNIPTLDANGLNLTIQGDFTNYGTYTSNNNTTIFSSNSDQLLSGTGTEDFYKLTKTGSGTFSLSKNSLINSTLDIDQGTLNTDIYSLSTKGNVVIDGSISSVSGSGIIFNGDSKQYLSRSSVGQSSIGIMTLNNDKGVQVIDNGHSFYISNSLRLQEGVFNIGGSLLEIGEQAIIDSVESFGISNMIQTNSSFQDNGIKKNFTSGNTTDFVFPVGQLIYSPISIDFTGSGISSTGTSSSLTARPANEFHATIDDGDEYFVATGDTNNVLQYYWILRANDVSSMYADVTFNYQQENALSDATGYDSTLYIAARIRAINNIDEKIDKFTVDEVIEDEFKVLFNFNGEGDNGITGDYFAGINEAIPANVATYNTAGTIYTDITDTRTYEENLPTDGIAPKGAVLVVSENDEIVFNVNNVNLYKTIINEGATLTIDGTERHRLGTVTGTGNLKIVSNTSDVSFPAGDYIDFFDCSGGSLEYAGTGSYSVLSGLSSLRKVVISGSGTKNMSQNDVQICEDFTLNGPIFDNVADQTLTVQGNMNINSGEFKSGGASTNHSAINVEGTLTVNGGTYSGENDGTDSFGALTITSGTFDVGSGGTISVSGDLSYSGDFFNGGSGTSKLIMNGSSAQNITGTFTGASEFHNIEISNAAGINLSGNVTIDNQLTLTNGLVTPANTLLINDGATISPSNGSATSYINGKLNKIIGPTNNSFAFPVGAAGQYRPTGVYNVTTSGLTWEVEYFKSSPTSHASVDNILPTDDVAITGVSAIEYWVITDNGGSSDANIGLSWGTDSKVSENLYERVELQVMVWNNAADKKTWDHYGGGGFSSGHSANGGSFTSEQPISFSTNIVTLGSGDINNSLPIELIDFTAVANPNSIDLFWATATETNNDYFEIERSTDGIYFETIINTPGAGNSSVRIDYTATDYSPIYGTAYYRLKQTDYNGDFSYSTIISVFWNADGGTSASGISVYPNPFQNGDLTLETKNIEPGKSIQLNLTNFSGQTIYNVSLVNPDNQSINLVPMAISELPQGMYIISVFDGHNFSKTKLVVE